MKKRYFTLFWALLLMIQFCSAQKRDWAWARNEDPHGPYTTFKVEPEHSYGRSMAIDAQGNIYVLGSMECPYFTLGNTTLTRDKGETFLAKYSPAGKVLWAFNAGSGHTYAITADANGNVYFAGDFNEPKFNLGTFSITNSQVLGGWEVYLAKCDSAGKVLWVKSAGGNGDKDVYGVSADGSGNVYLTGIFGGPQMNFGDITIKNYVAVDFHNLAQTFNAFLAKYDGSGNVLWAKCAGGQGPCYSTGVAVTPDGGACITGYFGSAYMAFGTFSIDNSKTPGIRLSNFYVAKYDAQGNAVWGHGTKMDDASLANRITTDPAGNIYTIGSFMGKKLDIGGITLTNMNAANKALFITKYDASGAFQWAKTTGGIDRGDRLDICTDADGNCYTTGGYYNGAVYGSDSLLNTGATVIKFDGQGNVLWAQSIISDAETSVVSGVSKGIAADTKGNIYLTGESKGKDLVFGKIILPNVKASRKGRDFFLAKMNH